jgi:MFS family permease
MPEIKGKLNYLKTFIIGLGFFTTGVSWALYNSYMPIFLRDYIESSIVIGFIMALDNIVAIFFYPLIGSLSDRIRTRFGRRMPFVLLGIPIAAVFFALIPFDKTIASLLGYSLQGDLTAAFIIRMVFVMSFIIGMTIYRSPVIALMPDVTPDKHRSTANGIINLMGGVGTVFAFFVGSRLYGIDRSLPFIVTSIIMVISMVLMFLFVKEPKIPPVTKEKEEKVKIIPAIKEVFTDKDKSALLILLAILLWFMAYQALETWFTTYATKNIVQQENITNLEKTRGWDVEVENGSLRYVSPNSNISLDDGDTVVMLPEEEGINPDENETVIVKPESVVVLSADGNYHTVTGEYDYLFPKNGDKRLILADNGRALIVSGRIEKDVLDITTKFTIASPSECSIEVGDTFCRWVKENEASNAMTYFGLMFILISIPAGLLSKKIGRKTTIMIGIVGLIVILGISLFLRNIHLLTAVLSAGGIFWAFININSITMVWEIATNERLGTYTGLYYFFSQAAAVTAPPLFGVFFDFIGFGVLFPVSIGFFLLALLCMNFVRKGEYVEKKPMEEGSSIDVFD